MPPLARKQRENLLAVLADLIHEAALQEEDVGGGVAVYPARGRPSVWHPSPAVTEGRPTWSLVVGVDGTGGL